MSFYIRSATTKDIQIIANFQCEMALETESLELNKEIVFLGVKNCMEDKSKGYYFVAEEDEKVIGSLLITFEWSDWRNRTVWWIQSVFVPKEHRGKGVFKKLYQHIKEKVEADDSIGGLRLYVDNTNKKAQEVYTKLGMNGEHYSVFEWMV